MNRTPLPASATVRSRLTRAVKSCTVAVAVLGLLAPAAYAAGPQRDPALKREVEAAINRGLNWYKTNQNANGSWSLPDQPALTAMVLTAYNGEPSGKYLKHPTPEMQKGFSFLMSCVQPDGGIHQTNLVTYNTATCMMALITAHRQEFNPTIAKARRYLISLQGDFGEKGKNDSPFDGGIGYGSHYEHSDMGNTLQALEAIYYSKNLSGDRADSGDKKDLNWQAAIEFLQNCQNLPSHNKQAWSSADPKNTGGFIYYPGHSMAGAVTNSATGRVAFRSYGSVSYAGLMSYAYADLKKNDPRVTALLEWLQKNYTLDENPGMGLEGLFYYYNAMAKALTAYGINELTLASGEKINWRHDLAKKLLSLQRADGSWVNESARWWQKDPVLVTGFVVSALEHIDKGL